MKVLKVIKKIIIGFLGVIFFSFAIAMTLLLLNYNNYGLTQFGNKTLVIIDDDISSDNYDNGDLVIVETRKIKNVAVGDEVFAYKLDSEGLVCINVGIVGKVHEEDDQITFENGSTYSMKFVAGEAYKVVPQIGTYLSIISSKWGFLFVILVPSFLIFIYEFYALIVEIKYGKEER